MIELVIIEKLYMPLSNGLEKLMQLNIISDEDDLNDLLHNLINRLIYVLKLAGSDLPIDFYFNLSKQLAATSWMKIPEVESAVTSKSQKIEQTFLLSRVKSQASADFGIL